MLNGQQESMTAAMVGRTGLFRTREGLVFRVYIADIRKVYGRTDYFVRPSDNPEADKVWIEQSRVKLD